MYEFKLKVDHDSSIPKYRQIINQIEDAAGSGLIKPGDSLPSVNELIRELELSRDTVFKAYEHLKKRGLIESIQSKGYFVRKVVIRVLLFLDKYSPFKEGLYNSMRGELPENYSIDLYFHHYNIDVFHNVLENGIGRYNFFVIMSFSHEKVQAILSQIDKKKSLILDVVHGAPEEIPRIYQDFNESFYSCLAGVEKELRTYNEILFVLRPETHHPPESAKGFINFCSDYGLRGKVLSKLDEGNISSRKAYIVVSDEDLVMIVEYLDKNKLQIGKDIGLISYNDTPVKKVIAGGITVISTDFARMGRATADYLKHPSYVNIGVPTKLIKRNSL
jgi:DNA-binding transcriptional regulator YhcF (GntR family)